LDLLSLAGFLFTGEVHKLSDDCVFAHAYTYIHAFQNGILTRKNDVDEGFERKPEGYSNISAVGRKSIVSMAISEQIELCRVSRVIP